MDMPEETAGANKGAIIKLFGVVLIILGALDSMLFWRAGLAIGDGVVAIFAAGAFLYLTGAVRQMRKT